MRAILLAAGYGKRLIPITKRIPKCMVKIKKITLLDIWISKLINLGIKKILINTHYKHKLVSSFIKKHKYKKFLEISHEDKLLGTAGTLIKNINFSNKEDLMLIHADNFTKDNLKNFVRAHEQRPKRTEFTMMLFKTSRPKECGVVQIGKDKVVKKFFEKSRSDIFNANAAIYILSKKFLKKIEKKKFKDFSMEIIPKYEKKIYTYKTKSFFTDIGTPNNLKLARKNS